MACKIPRWVQLKSSLQNLGPEEFMAAYESTPGSLLIDVRTGIEFKHWALPDAIHLDYLAVDFWERLEMLDKETAYFVYCRTGRRSARVCTYMQNSGFKRVFNLDGRLTDILFVREV